MKRMIFNASRKNVYMYNRYSQSNKYPVTEIKYCPFKRMVAFNLTDTEEKAKHIRNSSIYQQFIIPSNAILVLSQADANSIIEALSKYYPEEKVTPSTVASVLTKDRFSGLIASKDGTMYMIAGSFERRNVE